MDVLLLILLAFPCGGIAISAVCRLNVMHPKVNRRGWMLMYLCFGAFAVAVWLDVAHRQISTATALLGLVAMGLNLLLTHRHWKDGITPPATHRDQCQT